MTITSRGYVFSLMLAGCSATAPSPPSQGVGAANSMNSIEAGSSYVPPSGGGGTSDAVAPVGDMGDASNSAVMPPINPAGPGADAAGNTTPMADASGIDAAMSPVDASSKLDASAEAATSGPVTPPIPDTASTLGISSPGSGYHVEGNIPYGPFTVQRLDVMYPNAAGPKGTTTLPGVIMFHGGGWIDNKPAALKASMSSFFDRFLAHGFLVCNVEYRLADGTANGAIAPAAVQDALLAAKWFWDHMDYYHVDKTRYVSTGGSAGGHLALMVGMTTPAAQLGPTSPNDFKIAAVVNGYGPSDVTDLLAKNIGWAVQWLPANTPNRAALAQQVSPVTYVRKDLPPIITVQGDMDHTVPMTESTNLYNLLTAAGAVTALHFVAGAGHGFGGGPATAWPDAEATMFAFLTANGI